MVFEGFMLREYSHRANGFLPCRVPRLTNGVKPAEAIFTTRLFHGWQIQEVDNDLRKKPGSSVGGSAGFGRV